MSNRNTLTWQNVTAPDFKSSSDLFDKAIGQMSEVGEHLQSAITNFDKPAARAAELQFAQNLAQYQDPEQLRQAIASGAFTRGIDPSRITPEMYAKSHAFDKELTERERQQALLDDQRVRTGILQNQDRRAEVPFQNQQTVNELLSNPATAAAAARARQLMMEGKGEEAAALITSVGFPGSFVGTLLKDLEDPAVRAYMLTRTRILENQDTRAELPFQDGRVLNEMLSNPTMAGIAAQAKQLALAGRGEEAAALAASNRFPGSFVNSLLGSVKDPAALADKQITQAIEIQKLRTGIQTQNDQLLGNTFSRLASEIGMVGDPAERHDRLVELRQRANGNPAAIKVIDEEAKRLGVSFSPEMLASSPRTNYFGDTFSEIYRQIEDSQAQLAQLSGSGGGSGISGSKNKEDFFAEISPFANAVAAELGGIDPNIIIAQSALETGWGKSKAGGNNYFGIKADKSWGGPSTSLQTKEQDASGKERTETARFRNYASPEESAKDYVNFLRSNPRYSKALERASVGDTQGFITELANAGYATDKNYVSKIQNIAVGLSGEAPKRQISSSGSIPLEDQEEAGIEDDVELDAQASELTKGARSAFENVSTIPENDTEMFNLAFEVLGQKEVADLVAKSNNHVEGQDSISLVRQALIDSSKAAGTKEPEAQQPKQTGQSDAATLASRILEYQSKGSLTVEAISQTTEKINNELERRAERIEEDVAYISGPREGRPTSESRIRSIMRDRLAANEESLKKSQSFVSSPEYADYMALMGEAKSTYEKLHDGKYRSNEEAGKDYSKLIGLLDKAGSFDTGLDTVAKDVNTLRKAAEREGNALPLDVRKTAENRASELLGNAASKAPKAETGDLEKAFETAQDNLKAEVASYDNLLAKPDAHGNFAAQPIKNTFNNWIRHLDTIDFSEGLNLSGKDATIRNIYELANSDKLGNSVENAFSDVFGMSLKDDGAAGIRNLLELDAVKSLPTNYQIALIYASAGEKSMFDGTKKIGKNISVSRGKLEDLAALLNNTGVQRQLGDIIRQEQQRIKASNELKEMMTKVPVLNPARAEKDQTISGHYLRTLQEIGQKYFSTVSSQYGKDAEKVKK